jgi:signal transduction histidine kinase
MASGLGLTAKLFAVCIVMSLVSTGATCYFAMNSLNSLEGEAMDGIARMGQNAKGDSTKALKELGENMILNIGRGVVKQLEIYISTHPNMTVPELQNDSVFRGLAVQGVGDTGYTALTDLDNGTIYFHPQTRLVNTGVQAFEGPLPAIWLIFNRTLTNHTDSSGYYLWKEADGSFRDKFMTLTILNLTTADGRRMFIAATTYIDEFLKPVKETEARINATTAAVDARLREEQTSIQLVFTGLIITMVVVLVIVVFLLSRTITRPIIALTKVTDAIKKGEIDRKIDIRSRDEIGDLAESIDSMRNEIRKRTSELIQSEKMASIGLLVAGVSHEVNNPLTYIKSNTEFVKDDLAELKKQCAEKGMDMDIFGRLDKMLTTNVEGINRIAVITKTLKRFAKPDTGEQAPADINQGIKDTLVIVHNRLKHRVDVHEDYGKLPELKCNLGQLNQVFMNLIINSSDAMDKGDIWLRTWADRGNLFVEVKDNGHGIPKDSLLRIFDPFFTTKKEGTGLGLSLSYRIVKECRGDIMVESEEGKGTTMTVRLPLEGK